jgi:GAF domain-containing protein
VTFAPADVEPGIRRAIDAAPDLPAALAAVVAGLAAASPRYHWVGIYRLDGDTLLLEREVGLPTPHRRIPLGQGLCGAAARERATIVVDDVRADPRYLACSAATRSEIVVPIIRGDGRVFGEIDIDSDDLAAFGEADRRLLEALAVALAARVDRSGAEVGGAFDG